MKKHTVTIGIPAYNEEANIKKLLEALLVQKKGPYTLQKIIIISDGSTDETVNQILQMKSKIITLVDHKTRKGQVFGQKEIFRRSHSDITVLLNADIIPASDTFLTSIISPFIDGRATGIVGAKVTPLKEKTFVEHIVNCSVAVKQTMYEQIHSGDTLYLCHGRARAFSREFIKRFQWKSLLNEDAYSYLECLRLGFTFHFEPTAEIYYRSPQTIRDHIRQSKRFLVAFKELEPIYDLQTLRNNYKISFSALASIVPFLLRNPFFIPGYTLLFCLSSFLTKINSTYSVQFVQSKTSKQL